MEVKANHIQLRHQLNDDLQIEQVYTCYVDGDHAYPVAILRDGLAGHFNPVLSNFQQKYQFQGSNFGTTLIHTDYSYPAQYHDYSTTTSNI